MMGDAFAAASSPSIRVKLTGTAKFAKVHVIKDNAYVYSKQPGSVPGKTSYYYVRGEQEDGQLMWASPMWITYNLKP